MRFFRRRAAIFAVVTLFFLLFSKGTAHAAGIDSSLKDMFNSFGSMTSSTAAGAYKGQTRGYLTGGSISIRNPNKTYQLLTYDSPKFEAGCGGLDLYLGSFSYIDADKFEQLIKNIGSAALGYTVQLAIGVLCQQCKATLNEIDGIMRKINAMSANSCAAAKAIMTGMGADKQIAAWGQKIEDLATQKGVETDASAATKKASEPGGVASMFASVNSSLPEIEKPYGNLTYDALSSAGMGIDDIQLIMSVTGTIIWTQEGIQEINAPLITSNDIFSGGTGLDVYVCDEMASCLNPSITKKDIQGFSSMTYERLTSIAKNLQDGTAISDSDQSFVNLSNIPVFTLLESISEPTGKVRELLIENASETIALMFTIGWLDYATRQTLLASSTIKKGVPSSSLDVYELLFKAQQTNYALQTQLSKHREKAEAFKIVIANFSDTFKSKQGGLSGNLAFE